MDSLSIIVIGFCLLYKRFLMSEKTDLHRDAIKSIQMRKEIKET